MDPAARAYSLPPTNRRWRIVRGAAVLALTLYALVLRAEAVAGRYGPLEGSRTAVIVQEWIAPAGAHLRPGTVTWRRDHTPYVGGDPINYLKYAREMEGFYQPHVREPVFLAITRGFLALLNDRDVAVSFASGVSSVLVVPASYLLGAAAFGPLVGLGAAAAWAVELDAISWGVAGWRDDTFTLFFTLFAWALLRLRWYPSSTRALVAGACAAGAALTRLSSLSFVAPGLVWLILEPVIPRARRLTARGVLLSALVVTTLVGPYLASCWRATGDPFFAVNYHTRYYRSAEGLSPQVNESAMQFVVRQFRERPVAALDTMARGLVTWPFESKWRGFRAWSPHLPELLRLAAVAGLLLFLWQPTGRLLLVLLFCALLPYALTWNLGGGDAWRFSEHVYPIYLVAACAAIVAAWRLSVTLARRPATWRAGATRQHAIRAAITTAVALLAGAAFFLLPPLVAREALAAGEPVTIVADRRARALLVGNWSGPHRDGNVTVRAAQSTEVGVRLLLPRPMASQLTLRLDPPETTANGVSTVSVFLNRQHLGTVHLMRTPARMGTYRFRVPAEYTTGGLNRLDLIASRTLPAREAGASFGWVPAGNEVAFRLWYVRIEPH